MSYSRMFSILFASMAVIAAGCGQPEPEQQTESTGWDTSEEVGEEEPANDERDDETDSETNNGTDEEEEEEPGLTDGSPCTEDSECEGGTCLTGPDHPDGFCTQADCDASCESPDSGCVDSELGNFCAPRCEDDGECREGYVCDTAPGSPGQVCVLPTGAPDGAPCTGDSDCQGGTCIQEWPGGYCTTVRCDNYMDCARQGEDNKCLLNPRGPNLCVRICQTNDECREGYVCDLFGNGSGMCSPDPATPLDPAVLQGNPFALTCETPQNGALDISFDVAQDTSAYMITPLAVDGKDLSPTSIDRPSGDIVDFGGPNGFQTVPSYIYGGMNPTIVPATKQFDTQLEAGTHTYRLTTESDEICWYLLEEQQPGNTIDMNIYFVGVPDIDAATAPNDSDMQAVLDGFDSVYQQAGIELGEVRYFDITGDAADRYQTPRSEQDVANLVTLTQRPGPSMDEVLSINVFFVRAFAMRGGAIGISLGLPGPAALHGTHGSGVAFTSEYMGQQVQSRDGQSVDGNDLTAQVLAHEVGHYLGLFHTSEQNGYSHDPLPDTPECSQISQSCPDINNLMFPFAGIDHEIVTADQGWVIGVNPLTKHVDQTTADDDSSTMGNN